jgi:hypothetical protein
MERIRASAHGATGRRSALVGFGTPWIPLRH